MKPLANDVDFISANWKFVPLKAGENAKVPIGAEWQKSPLTLAQVQALLGKPYKGSKVGGYGVICGPDSNGLLMVDLDGESAHTLIAEWGELPQTWSVTSFRPGRKQLAYQVPKEFWSAIETRKASTGIIGDDGKPEQVELRWLGAQSVAYGRNPISGHEYQWTYPTAEPAIAPHWLIERMLIERKVEKPVRPAPAGVMPLSVALAPITRDRLNGKLDKGRNDCGAAIARDLIGAAKYLDSIGQRYSGDPRAIFDKWCQDTGLDQDKPKGQPNQIWRKAERDNPEPALTPEMIANCIEAWERKQQPQGKTKVVPIKRSVDKADDNPIEIIETEVDLWISDDLSGSALARAKASLTAKFPTLSYQIDSLYKARLSEADQVESANLAAAKIKRLANERADLCIEDTLIGDGGVLASQLKELAEAMPVAPEHLFTALIPVLATAIGTSSRIVIKASAGYVQPCIFRALSVLDTGRKKTPIADQVLNPIRELERKFYDQYQAELQEFEANERKGTPPARKRLIIQDDTTAARAAIHAENPRGVLLYKEEGSAFVTERGRYTHGKGDGGELENDLTEFSGGPLSRDRKGDGSVYIPKSAISRYGATHPQTLGRLMADHQDSMGEWARYLFCIVESPLSKLDLSGPDNPTLFPESVKQLFLKLRRLPETDYLLSQDAKECFQTFQHWLTDQCVEADHPGLAAAYPKFESYLARFSLWLHLVNACLADKPPSLCIKGPTVAIASQLVMFYIDQLKRVYALNAPSFEMTGDMMRIINYLEKRPNKTFTAREVQMARLTETLKTSEAVKAALQALTNAGFVQTDDLGKFQCKSA